MASSTAVEPARQLLAPRDAKGNASLPDLGLGPDEPLAHRRRRHEERRGDRLRIQPLTTCSIKRRANPDLYGRMGTGEHQGEAPVGDLRNRRRGLQLLREQPQLPARRFAGRAPPRAVDHLSAGHGQQPPFRARGQPWSGQSARAAANASDERVLGCRHVSRARREQSHELAVAATRDRVHRATRLGVAFIHVIGS